MHSLFESTNIDQKYCNKTEPYLYLLAPKKTDQLILQGLRGKKTALFNCNNSVHGSIKDYSSITVFSSS